VGRGYQHGRRRTANVREPNGRWIKGYQPEGAHPFPPGNNANPTGRPARKPFRDAIERLLNDDTAEEIIRALIASSKRKQRPDIMAATFLRDTLEGRPTQSLELSGEISLITKREIIAKRRAERLNGDR
jgi:hypothetical protein